MNLSINSTELVEFLKIYIERKGFQKIKKSVK